MEKVIQEFKVIETEDGFRIEVKGDKERMRRFIEGMDPRNWGHQEPHGAPPWGPPWRWARKSRRHGRGGFGSGMFFGFGAHPWWWCGDEEAEEEAPEEKDQDAAV
jgi:hypothetical protein